MVNLGIINNNAGNLRDPATGGFQKFDNPDAGKVALINDLEIKKSGKSPHIKPGGSIKDLANVWAPASDNNKPDDWANNVAKTVGVSANSSWADIPTEQLAQGIQVAEGTSTPNTLKKPDAQSLSSQDISKPQLSHEQLVANINAMESQGAKPEEVQGYLDSLKQSTPQKRKTFKEEIGNTQTPPSEPLSPGTPPPIPGVIDQLQKGDILGAGSSAIRKVGDFLTGGGSEQLGHVLGTYGGLGYEKLKGLVGGKDNSSQYDTSDATLKEGLVGAGKTAASIATIYGGGRLASGLIDAIKPASELSKPFISKILKGAVTEGETLTRDGAVTRLTAYLNNMPASEIGSESEQSILKAIKELAPTLKERQSILSKLVKGGINMAAYTALTNALGSKVGGLVHSSIPK